MSSGAVDIVDLIDGAIEGWHGSPDAMRWTPMEEWDEPIVWPPCLQVEHQWGTGWACCCQATSNADIP